MTAPILVGALLVIVGFVLVFVSSQGPIGQRMSSLGIEMLGGAVIAFAFGWIERRAERRQEDAAERQHLQLTLGLRQNLTGISLPKADLAGFYLRGRILNKADLTSTNLVRANLEEAVLIGANLALADLVGANLEEAELSSADLTDAKLCRANLAGARLRGTILVKAKLEGAVLTEADLTNANLREARLVGANLRGAHLEEVEHQGEEYWVTLEEAVLIDANLTDANVSGARLQGADLRGAHLTNTNLAEARADANTQWPEGFDPEAAGVILVDKPRPKGEHTDSNASASAGSEPQPQEATLPPSDGPGGLE